MSGIWGSSPNDVWAVGGGGTASDATWHYDGKKWIPWFKNNPASSSGIWPCAGFTLYGFGSNDVWVGGQSADPDHNGSAISHWNGNLWGQYFYYNPAPDSFSIVIAQDIWGSRSTEVYACGVLSYSSAIEPQGTSMRGFLLRYDGSKWKEVAKGDSGYQYQFGIVRGERGDVFVQEFRGGHSGEDSTIIYKLSDGQLKIIYTMIGYSSDRRIGTVGDELYFPLGNDVYTYSNGAFVKEFSVDNPAYNHHLYGRNRYDIFISMWDGLVHYNGTDMEYLYRWPEGAYYIEGAILFEKEVFLLLGSGYANVVLHGTLK
jgi:hypothetical protein